MGLYLKECKKTAASAVYCLFIALLVISWYQNFAGVTGKEIRWADKGVSPDYTFDRPLLSRPSPSDDFFGTKTVEDPESIMRGATDTLLTEYRQNSYASYPFGYYKSVSLDDRRQSRVLEILCEITGLTPGQLKDLPDGYFPAVNGTTIHFNSAGVAQPPDGFTFKSDNTGEKAGTYDITRTFTPQVSYEQFKELMVEMEELIGENGSHYSPEMMITYYGLTEKTYEDAAADYRQTISKDLVTGGFARLFCDYMGQAMGLYPVFLAAGIWMKDRRHKTEELIYCQAISSARLVITRYLALLSVTLLPVLLLSLESLIPLIGFSARHGLAADYFAYLKYILWWLLPTVMIVTAAGSFLTLLTDTPVSILFQFVWWTVARGTVGLSGDTGLFTLMIRHNSLRGYEVVQHTLGTICWNRIFLAGVSLILVILSVWVLEQKRKGKIHAADVCKKWLIAGKHKLDTIRKS